MPDKDEFKPTFKDAAIFAVVIQGVLWVLAGLVLDGGVLSRTVEYSALFFWAAVSATAAVRCVRWNSGFSMTDYLLTKYGFVFMIVVSVPLNMLVGALRG